MASTLPEQAKMPRPGSGFCRKVRTAQMPPAGMPKPDAATAKAFVARLENTLDRAAEVNPYPGAPMPHRLNRVEYSNAIRDLLALDTQPGRALPVDESGNGFDNMADLLSVSPALFERYLTSPVTSAVLPLATSNSHRWTRSTKPKLSRN